MEYRRLGTSDLQVPVVILGAWAIGGWYWGGSDDEAAVRAIHAAADVGMTCIDTAPVYGFGRSERVVGRAVKGRRERYLLATKCGLVWSEERGEFFFDAEHEGKTYRVFRNLRRDSILRECDQSLRRLGTEYIDLYQCHWPDATASLSETGEALLRLREQGKIRAAGVSNFSPEAIEELSRAVPIVSDQPHYSLLERGIERDVLPYARRTGLGVIVYRPIEQGLLSGRIGTDHVFPEGDLRGWDDWMQPENRARVLSALARIEPIARDHRATLAQVAIAWTIGEPGVTAAIVGARTPAQVEENAAAAAVKLTTEERSFIRRVFEGLGEPA